MKSFRTYLDQMNQLAESVDDLDMKFLSNAEKVSSFNLVAKDFETLQYKKELQFLFTKHFFPDMNTNDFLDKIDQNKFNNVIAKLKALDFKNFVKLHKYGLKGIGPGEVLMFYVLNNGHLGGGSSAGIDLIDNNVKYEIKAVEVTSKGYANQFKVGGTFDISGIMFKAMALKKKVGAKGEGVNTTTIKMIISEFPKEWESVVQEFRDVTYKNYFSKHPIIFMRNSTKKIGEIVAIKNVKKSDIELDRITSGTIKPMVKL